MQEDMDIHITRDRLSEASFCRKFYPITKNIIRGKNPLKLVLMLPTFGMQNSLIGSRSREIDIRKKDLAGNIVNKASSSINFETKWRLHALEKNNDSNDKKNNNGGYIAKA